MTHIPPNFNEFTPYRNNNGFNDKPFCNNSGRINLMTSEQLMGTLKYHGLNASGSQDVLRQRLKEYMKQQVNNFEVDSSTQSIQNMYSYFLIIDFEATCEETNEKSFPHEIIEFPIILYDVVLRRKVDVFHAYCKPHVNPYLTDFCKSLTHINQATVDNAKSFLEVLAEVNKWLNKHRIFDKPFAVVCDCNADMAKFMRIQCELSEVEFPSWCRYWINAMKSFRQFYKVSMENKLNMQKMLSTLGLEFEGRQHSGLHDAENLLRIVETMVRDGYYFFINEKLDPTPPYYTANVNRKEAIRMIHQFKSAVSRWNSDEKQQPMQHMLPHGIQHDFSHLSIANNAQYNTNPPQPAIPRSQPAIPRSQPPTFQKHTLSATVPEFIPRFKLEQYTGTVDPSSRVAPPTTPNVTPNATGL